MATGSHRDGLDRAPEWSECCSQAHGPAREVPVRGRVRGQESVLLVERSVDGVVGGVLFGLVLG